MKKFLLSLVLIILGTASLMLMLDVFSYGLRIMLFGVRLTMVPVAALFLVVVTIYLFLKRPK